MNIDISLAEGFRYSSTSREFPVDVTISTDVVCSIGSRVEVSLAILSRVDDPDGWLGYSKRVFPGRRQFVELSPEDPMRFRIDVFEHTDDFESFRPGLHRCTVRVEVAERVGETVRPVFLEASLEIDLS